MYIVNLPADPEHPAGPYALSSPRGVVKVALSNSREALGARPYDEFFALALGVAAVMHAYRERVSVLRPEPSPTHMWTTLGYVPVSLASIRHTLAFLEDVECARALAELARIATPEDVVAAALLMVRR